MFEDIQQQIDQTISELEVKANVGDAEAQSDLFVFLNAKAMEEYDPVVFDRAEEMLKRSAEQGWNEAINRLKEQDLRRKIFTGRCNRHGQT